MNITAINLQPFQLPFAGSFQTAHGPQATRNGVILQIMTDTGQEGLGEATTLPEFGGGRLPDVLRLLECLLPGLIGQTPASAGQAVEQLLSKSGPGRAALACGLDTALCDLLAQQADLPLHAWLLQSGTRASEAESIPVNATIGAAGTEAALNAAVQAVEQGFKHLKLKVGTTNSVEQEVERINRVRSAIGPATGLRLDANGAWEVKTALEILNQVANLNIELIEQPVAAADLAGMAFLTQASPVLIAADEPVTGLEAARQIIEMKAAGILVIKPMVVGGLRPARQIIEMAARVGVECIVTTSIDSGVGITAALHLAATLAGPVRPCGLATASLLKASLVKNLPEIKDGQMWLPRQAGLGVHVDMAQLKQFRYGGPPFDGN